ncbi:MAG: hypothetical protein HOP17_07245 [Acidobacteria bacterium]|nr:hypothetical protein [Acidobacteriota bacterium]
MSLKKTPDFLQNLLGTEMNGTPRQLYCFKSFRLDVAERQMFNNGTPVPLTPKAFDLLAYLVERSGHLVEKEELMQTIWADSFVEDANLTRAIHTLRRALGEDNEHKYIETVAKKGYRFVAEVNREDGEGVSMLSRDIDHEPAIFTDLPSIESDAAEPHAYAPPVRGAFSNRVIFLGLAVLIASALLAFLALKWNGQATGESGPAVSIVILPFRPIDTASRDEAYDLFFADSLITQLSQGARNLQVRSFSAVRGYTDVKQDAVNIGKEQKANYVVESSYVVADGRLRGTWKLLNVADGSVAATSSYDLDGSNRYSAAENVSLKIAPELLSKLKFAPVKPVLNRSTNNDEAWEHYRYGMKTGVCS